MDYEPGSPGMGRRVSIAPGTPGGGGNQLFASSMDSMAMDRQLSMDSFDLGTPPPLSANATQTRPGPPPGYHHQSPAGSTSNRQSSSNNNRSGGHGNNYNASTANYLGTGTGIPIGNHSGASGGVTLDVATIMEDPVTLMLMLNKHKQSLSMTLKEINALKAVIQGQEATIGKLNTEKQSLMEQLRAQKETEGELVGQIQSLSEACEDLTTTMQRRGVESASRVNGIESQKRESEFVAKAMIDRLNTQLVSTQNPVSSARPMPWSKIQAIDGHPAGVLREVVLHDSRREESLLSRAMTVSYDEDLLGKLQEYSRPPLVQAGSRGIEEAMQNERNSEDESFWRQACARLYVVLGDRRKMLSTGSDPSPMEYLLRTRSQLVAEVCHVHSVVNRCSTLVAILFDRLESVVSSAGGQAIGGQLELVAATVADMDATLHRVKTHCFTSADCAFHGVSSLGVTSTAFTEGRSLLPGGTQASAFNRGNATGTPASGKKVKQQASASSPKAGPKSGTFSSGAVGVSVSVGEDILNGAGDGSRIPSARETNEEINTDRISGRGGADSILGNQSFTLGNSFRR